MEFACFHVSTWSTRIRAQFPNTQSALFFVYLLRALMFDCVCCVPRALSTHTHTHSGIFRVCALFSGAALLLMMQKCREKSAQKMYIGYVCSRLHQKLLSRSHLWIPQFLNVFDFDNFIVFISLARVFAVRLQPEKNENKNKNGIINLSTFGVGLKRKSKNETKMWRNSFFWFMTYIGRYKKENWRSHPAPHTHTHTHYAGRNEHRMTIGWMCAPHIVVFMTAWSMTDLKMHACQRHTRATTSNLPFRGDNRGSRTLCPSKLHRSRFAFAVASWRIWIDCLTVVL